jgi:hypothetical protein
MSLAHLTLAIQYVRKAEAFYSGARRPAAA